MTGRGMLIGAFAVILALLAGLYVGGSTMERITADRLAVVIHSMEQRERTRESFIAAQATEIDAYRDMVSVVGVASWYGAEGEHGRITASGTRFNRFAFTAASKFMPFGSTWIVRNLENGKQTEVTITDDGPNVPGRIVDLSEASARALGFDKAGLARVVMTPAIGKGE
jgi:rare lipoprotein A (peptidoglycan hydrolase)